MEIYIHTHINKFDRIISSIDSNNKKLGLKKGY